MTMNSPCSILLFAHAADAVGSHELSLELPAGATVADAMNAICTLHPKLSAMRTSLAVAVNEKYARMDDIIPAGATIAIIPPVSGG